MPDLLLISPFGKLYSVLCRHLPYVLYRNKINMRLYPYLVAAAVVVDTSDPFDEILVQGPSDVLCNVTDKTRYMYWIA